MIGAEYLLIGMFAGVFCVGFLVGFFVGRAYGRASSLALYNWPRLSMAIDHYATSPKEANRRIEKSIGDHKWAPLDKAIYDVRCRADDYGLLNDVRATSDADWGPV